MSNMKALVTGGAGYIGSHLVDYLLGQGYEVYVVDNLSTGKIANVAHQLSNGRFHFINDTILNDRTMEEVIRQVDVVYHLAAVVGVKHVVDNPLNVILTNVRGTEVVMELAYKYWRKVVMVSSSEVYGKSEKVPLSEENDAILGPTAVGRWSYALSKALDEHLAFAYHSRGLPTVIVRYFNSYGPRLDPRGYGSVMAKFINKALRGEPLPVYGDGRQTRCFTHVSDTVRGTFLAGTVEGVEGNAFNVGSDRETSILELAKMVCAEIDESLPIELIPYDEAYGPNFEETLRRVPDVRKARELLGFEPGVRLEEGLKEVIRWFAGR